MTAEASIQQLNSQSKAPNHAAPGFNPSARSISSEQNQASNAKAPAQHYHAMGMNIVPLGPDKAPARSTRLTLNGSDGSRDSNFPGGA